MVVSLVVFFFKQKTAYEMRIGGWSSDVSSSDLCRRPVVVAVRGGFVEREAGGGNHLDAGVDRPADVGGQAGAGHGRIVDRQEIVSARAWTAFAQARSGCITAPPRATRRVSAASWPAAAA